jgi:hypothetical protein
MISPTMESNALKTQGKLQEEPNAPTKTGEQLPFNGHTNDEMKNTDFIL